jgi:hypothetical protein
MTEMIDKASLENNLEAILFTTLHELRHEYQRAVIANPENFPEVASETVAEWTANMPPDGPVEPDAREWAESMLIYQMDKLTEELKGAAKQ